MLITADRPRDAELVIGLVAPVGTRLDAVVAGLKSAFGRVGYVARDIHLSDLLSVAPGGSALPTRGQPNYLEARMNAGDTLRETLRTGDALAGLAVAAIRERRKQDGDEHNQAARRAWILNSLKHPEEADLLRLTYGRRFVLVGVTEPAADRLEAVVARLRTEQGTFGSDLRARAQDLLARDEKDASHPFGQRVRDTYSAADVFVHTRGGVTVEPELARLVEILFGQPGHTPRRDELAMYYAQAAALRSSAAGRQVGAVIATAEGDLLSIGTNEVPKPTGGQYWHGDAEDHRDVAVGADFNDQAAARLVHDVLERLRASGWLDSAVAAAAEPLVERALGPGGPLADARVLDLLEFGRIAHAEMAAIDSAARRGVAVAGATLYTTTYPCHMCARQIIDAGLDRVVYVDPYPKSLVPEMFRDMIDESGQPSRTPNRVRFDAFAGVSPRMFADVFAKSKRQRDIHGRFEEWVGTEAAPVIADYDSLTGADASEAAVTTQLLKFFEDAPAPVSPMSDRADTVETSETGGRS